MDFQRKKLLCITMVLVSLMLPSRGVRIPTKLIGEGVFGDNPRPYGPTYTQKITQLPVMGVGSIISSLNIELPEEEVTIKESEEYQEIKEVSDKPLEISDSRNTHRVPQNQPTRGSIRDLGVFTVTNYDLSVQSCGKPIGHKYYGVTASGFNLTGHTWETARAIAVDPKVIPMGSEVEITFIDEKYSKYDGTYTAVDTGGAIKGNKIDLFLGDFNQNETHQDVWDFGVTKAHVELLRGDD